jgi:hypothetical protein
MIDPNDPGTLDLVAACEEPLSGAERARRHRLKKKQAGVKEISLTHTERCVLSLGVLAHEDLDHRQANWETSKKPGFDALLRKLWPEGDNGRYLAEPNRSTYRPAAFLRNQLADARTENQRLKSALNEIAAEVSGGALAPVPQASEVDALRREVARLEQENRLLEAERNGSLAAIKVYVARLSNAKLSTDYRRQPGE